MKLSKERREQIRICYSILNASPITFSKFKENLKNIFHPSIIKVSIFETKRLIKNYDIRYMKKSIIRKEINDIDTSFENETIIFLIEGLIKEIRNEYYRITLNPNYISEEEDDDDDEWYDDEEMNED